MKSAWPNVVRWAQDRPLWLRTSAASAAFLLAIALTAWRTASLLNDPAEPRNDARWALGDFRDAVYYPSRAFLNGDNPYGPAYTEAYPVYGVPSKETIEAIRLSARLEGMMTDPVYEGKSMQGMIDLVKKGFFPAGSKVLYAHLGGVPAINGYSYTFRNG